MVKCTEFVWIQRDGTSVRVRDMSDSHLLCTIRMLRRWATKMSDKENALSMRGCWDSSDFEQEYWWEPETFLKSVPTWPTLQFERRMRSLEELPIVE